MGYVNFLEGNVPDLRHQHHQHIPESQAWSGASSPSKVPSLMGSFKRSLGDHGRCQKIRGKTTSFHKTLGPTQRCDDDFFCQNDFGAWMGETNLNKTSSNLPQETKKKTPSLIWSLKNLGYLEKTHPFLLEHGSHSPQKTSESFCCQVSLNSYQASVCLWLGKKVSNNFFFPNQCFTPPEN